MAASVVINLLATYSSLAVHYPPKDKLERHRNQLFATWAKELDEDLSTETCQRLVSAFQDHFSPESPVLAAKQQRIVDFNLCLLRLLNEASMRLHQTSLQLAAEDDVGQSTEEDGQQPVDAVVEMLRRIYKQQVEPALVPSQSASFDDLLVASSQACRVAELLPGPVLLDPYISSMSSVVESPVAQQVISFSLALRRRRGGVETAGPVAAGHARVCL